MSDDRARRIASAVSDAVWGGQHAWSHEDVDPEDLIRLVRKLLADRRHLLEQAAWVADQLPWRGWHHADLEVRNNGRTETYQADRLKDLAYAVEFARDESIPPGFDVYGNPPPVPKPGVSDEASENAV